MPAPAVFEAGAIDPFAHVLPEGRRLESEILFATDRDPATANDIERHYASRRGYLVRLGRAEIVHGDGRLSWQEARRLSLEPNRRTPYRLQVGVVEELGVLPGSVSRFTDPALLAPGRDAAAAGFAAEINAKLARSNSRDITVYVHGFKVPFENPLLVATELWHFMGYDGVMIPYSWPSTPRLLAYFSDVETTALSAHYLRQFITYLRQHTDAERIHVLGYSAGTRLVIEAVSMLALAGGAEARNSGLGEIILVGSDYDTGLFAAALSNGILDVTERLTVCLSGIDGALRFANRVFGRERLGQMLSEEMPAHVREVLLGLDNLVLIDVSDAESAGARNGHSYFRESPWVSSDILATLTYGLSPAERGLIRADPEVPIWTYPPDFIERLRNELVSISAGRNGLR
jgi:esterase/lipase superfamily enzyme